jgi:hypothetical protein
VSDNGSTVTKSRGAKGSIILILWHYTRCDNTDNVEVEGRVFDTILFLLERYFSVLSGSGGGGCLDTSSSSSSNGSSSRGNSSSSGGAEIISTLVTVVAVGRGGDYLDTCCSSSGRRRWRLSGELSCSETVLWTTNCPLVLAYCGLGTAVTFWRLLYTFRIRSVFLLIHKIHA